jgi:sialic acid synthase SpsE
LKTFIIAEIGVNHDGNLEKAKRLIRSAKLSGADAVKFQTFKAEQLVTSNSPKAKYQETSTGSGTQFEMLKSLELSYEQFAELNFFSSSLGIEFMSTPFDIDSLHFLLSIIKVKRIKLSSGDLTNLPFIYEVGKSKVSTIISTGGSTLEEIDNAVIAWALGRNEALPDKRTFIMSETERLATISSLDLSDLSILQCTTQYPASTQNLNLRVITKYLERYPCKIGFSDHSIGYEAALGAVALGACIVEKHITESKNDSGPDHSASMEIIDFTSLVDSIRLLETALGGYEKFPTTEELETIQIARKSLVAARNIAAGHQIKADDVIILRPLGGFAPSQFWSLMGAIASGDILKGDFLNESNISRIS